ncbi:MAG TPA: BTAD domain-containing putative transcriptional regulator [Streptomyces sp.]|nr:BTAD domain-containing putative transcriptional regulator [Streptomyces sp.]
MDRDLFEERVRRAREARGREDWEAVERDAGAALALWRGTPFADVPALAGHPGVSLLQEQRLQALECRIEALPRLDRLDGVAAELGDPVEEHPFPEALHRQLILGRTDRLAEVALLQEARFGRYAPHDLVRDFAREPAGRADERGRTAEAVERTLSWYEERLARCAAGLRPDPGRASGHSGLPRQPGGPADEAEHPGHRGDPADEPRHPDRPAPRGPYGPGLRRPGGGAGLGRRGSGEPARPGRLRRARTPGTGPHAGADQLPG